MKRLQDFLRKIYSDNHRRKSISLVYFFVRCLFLCNSISLENSHHNKKTLVLKVLLCSQTICSTKSKQIKVGLCTYLSHFVANLGIWTLPPLLYKTAIKKGKQKNKILNWSTHSYCYNRDREGYLKLHLPIIVPDTVKHEIFIVFLVSNSFTIKEHAFAAKVFIVRTFSFQGQ